MSRIGRFAAILCFSVLVFSATAAYAVSTQFITSVSFADSKNGFISGRYSANAGFMGYSRDSGNTWKAVSLPGNDMWAVSAWDATRAWAVSYGGTAFTTADAGGAWGPVAPISALSSPEMWGVTSFAADRVAAAGHQTDKSGAGTFGVIALSTNGGSTWSSPLAYNGPEYPDVEGAPTPTYAKLTGIDSARTGGAGWAVGNEFTDNTGQTLKRVLALKTTDSGATWTLVPVNVLKTINLVPTLVPVTDRFTRVTAASAQTMFAATTVGRVYKTADGGATWAATTQQPLLSVAIEGIDSFGENRVVVTGEPGWVAWTTNGGASWSSKQMSGQDRLRSIAMVSETTWVAVGDGLVVYRTTDAGATWTKATAFGAAPPPASAATALTLSTPSSYLAYGGTGTVAGYLKAGTATLPGQTIVLQKSSDGVNFSNTAITAVTSASGYFSLADKPKIKTYYRAAFAGATGYNAATPSARISFTPMVSLTAPRNGSTVRRGRSYTWYGYIKPKHTTGSSVVKVRFYRYKNGKYSYYKQVTAKAVYYSSATTKYSVKTSLPYTGKWRVRAFHDDAGHAATYSGYLYKRVY